MESFLSTPGMPGYRPPKKNLYDRLFKRKQNQPLDTFERDKEEFPIEEPAVNLENYSEGPLSIYDEMSDASSVNSDQILQEAQDIQNTFSLYNPPNADFLESDGDSFLFNSDSDTSFKFNLPNKTVRKLDREKNLIDYPSLKDYYEEMEKTNTDVLNEAALPPMPEMYKGYPISIPPEAENHVFMGNSDDFSTGWYTKGEPIEKFGDRLGASSMEMLANRVENDPNFPTEIGSPMHKFNMPDLSSMTDQELQNNLSKLYLPTSGTRPELFKRLVDAKEDPEIMQKAADKSSTLPKVQQGAQARLARQNSLQQPYPENWNPQANTKANRAWGAQNIANMERANREWGAQNIMAQEQARVSGLGTAARNAQAAEALPGAAARVGSMATRFGEGLSNFSARALPIINLGLLGYGLYNQAKNNRENERYRKMIEGNQI